MPSHIGPDLIARNFALSCAALVLRLTPSDYAASPFGALEIWMIALLTVLVVLSLEGTRVLRRKVSNATRTPTQGGAG
jgi:hypothetical protein